MTTHTKHGNNCDTCRNRWFTKPFNQLGHCYMFRSEPAYPCAQFKPEPRYSGTPVK